MKTIIKCSTLSSTDNWIVSDDIVMGGKSSSSFSIDPLGNGVFQGEVSLQNNGGFSSVQYRFDSISVVAYNHVCIKIKGDGKKYQFRIKASTADAHSYIHLFETSGEWQEICIPLNDMYPTFRGRKVAIANFNQNYIEAFTFLIGNKREEHFTLLVDEITLVKM